MSNDQGRMTNVEVVNPEDAPYPVIDKQCVIRAPTVREWSKPETTLPDGRGSVSSVRNRSEEHTSELQSPVHLVCRLLLEKKNIHQAVEHVAHIDGALTAATLGR